MSILITMIHLLVAVKNAQKTARSATVILSSARFATKDTICYLMAHVKHVLYLNAFIAQRNPLS